MHIKVVLKYIFLRDSMLMSRFGVAVGSLLWAIQLALPVALFPTASQIAEGRGRQTYAVMASLAPEGVWAALFLIHAVWAFYTILTNDRNAVSLAADGFLGCILWTGSTAACYATYWPAGLSFWDAVWAYPPPAAMSGELVMAFYSWWHMIRFWAEEETGSTNKGEPHGKCS